MGRFLKSLIISIAFLFIAAINVRASETMSLPITGTYDQSGARTFLELVNEKRSAVEGLGALSYDQELEDAAMLRAMEISVFFNGGRPDGSHWSTVLANPSSASQVIAYGQSTPDAALKAWMNTSSSTSNRDALLNSEYAYMGASHVTREGVNFWVIILRKAKGNKGQTAAINDKRVVSISMLSSKVLSNVSPSPINMEFGDEFDISDLKEQCGYSGAKTANKKWSYDISDTVKIEDDGIVTLKNKKLTGQKAGYTGITVTLKTSGENTVIPVNVAKKALTEEDIKLPSREYQYTGKAIKPAVTVIVSGKVLIEDIDYVMVYGDNVNVSSKGGYVSVTGLENYDGTIQKYFMIEGLDIGSGTISMTSNQLQYKGVPVVPEYSVIFGDKTLAEGTDYIVKLSDNNEAGVGHLTVHGIGNYKGTLTADFVIYENVSVVVSSSVKKAKVSSVTTSKKKISVTWTKVTKIDGYELQYSTNKKFKKSKTVSKTYKAKKRKVVLKKLKSGKTYYVRIRCYKNSGRTRLCSPWSKTVRIKVK